MPAALTRAYAEFAADLRSAILPDVVRDVVRRGFTDCAGVLLAGRLEPVVQRLAAYVRTVGAMPRSHLLFGTTEVSMAQAGLVNATAAHALEFDDDAFSNHPSAVLVPTVMAVADATGADGRRMVAGYAAGYEIWADLMLRVPDHGYPVGWRPIAVLGPIAAAAAASVVLGLHADQTMHALALAASLGGGVIENIGTMAMPIHGGRAAEAGLIAAGLAQAGIKASPTALEGETGRMRAVSPDRCSDRESTSRLGEDWHMARTGVNIKKYPMVGAAQRGIDATLALRRAHPIDPARIAGIAVVIGDRSQALMPFHRPHTAQEARSSVEFAVCCALLHGAVGVMQVQDEVVQAPEMQALFARVHPVVTTECDPDDPQAAPYDQVRVILDDGTELESPRVRRATGHADLPLPLDGLRAKFEDCAAYGGVRAAQRDALFDCMQRIDLLRSTRELPFIGDPD